MNELDALREALRGHGNMDRRSFVAFGTALMSVPLIDIASPSSYRPRYRKNPFSLGVASGDPDPSGFVLWTRLATEPLQADGGMPAESIPVQWELAEDEAMNKLVRTGTAYATPQLGHSVHVELSELKPNRWYWYRFRSGDAESTVGRTRTLPAPQELPDRLAFAVTSCQHFEQGLFTAYEQMARDEVDLVFHLGDYIYEYAAGRGGNIRTHIGKEIESLGDYRVRYSQYRTDPLLQSMHARCPWIVTWDDHEFDNNCANDISEEQGVDKRSYLERRANAYQAYYEMMPLRRTSMPHGPHLQLYRSSSFGRLAEFIVLDGRQYRSDQPNGDGRGPLNAAAMSPDQTMLGLEQRNWMYRSLLDSNGIWNVLAQQTMMGMVGVGKGGELFSMDQWPGYANERMQIMRFLADRKVPNPVVLTGDIHSNWVNELRIDDRKPEQEVVASEFVATSLSSGGNGIDQPRGIEALKAANPCIKYHNQERGYVRCVITPKLWTSDYMVTDDVEKPGGKTSRRASFAVEAGSPIVHEA